MPVRRSKKATETKNIRISKWAYKKLKTIALKKELTLIDLIDEMVA